VACDPGRAEDAPPLTARTYTGLLHCDGVEDTYRVEVPADEGLRVTLRHAPGDGDLTLALLIADAELARSDHPDGVEVLGVDGGPAERPVDVVVDGRPGWSTAYSLTLERQGPDWCAPDGWEGAYGNDDVDHATPIGLAPVEHGVCPGDEDWFAVPLPAGVRATVEATPAGAPGDLLLSLLGANGQVLDEAEVAGGGRSISAAADIAVPGEHHVRIRGSAPGLRTRDLLTVSTAPLADGQEVACAHALPLTPDEPLPLPPSIPGDVFAVTCSDGWGTDYVARFVLGAPAEVTVEVAGDHFGTTLAIRRTCHDIGTEEACAFGEDVALETGELAVGPWFVVADVGGGRRPELLLTVR